MLLKKLDAHHKFFIALITALIVFGLSYGRASLSTQFILTWISYAGSDLLLSWFTILYVHPLEMKKETSLQDSNRTFIFIFVLASALVSLFVVILLLKSTHQFTGATLSLHIFLSVAAVMLSWALVHTLFLFRYAHLYYEEAVQKKKDEEYAEGLEFPGEKEPDYLDFAYFSFVIGMTFQVSDVEISSKRIRRLALMHSLVAFAFNTVIVALSINIISGMISK